MRRQIFTFLIFFVALLIIFRSCSGSDSVENALSQGDVAVVTTNIEYSLDSLVTVRIQNNTNETITIANDCPSEPLNVFKYQNGDWVQKTATPKIDCENTDPITIAPQEEKSIDYHSWNHALFGEEDRYKISVETEIRGEMQTFESNEFRITPQSWIGYLWSTFFYQPIFNALIYILSFMPGHNLGLGIIALTILLRLILFIPAQRGLESQRKLQEIQPRLKKLQEQYKNNQQKLAQETMALYKQYKVNPLGSCLPLLIQLPVLIGLFYVIQTGLNPDNVHLLYTGLKSFDLSLIDANFYGLLDLEKQNIFVLPLIVGALQYIQMKLATNFRTKKNESNKPAKKDKEKGKGAEMEMANAMMVYIMPILIAVFTASVPSGVGLYWGTSTLFGIGQQYYVNHNVTNKKKKQSSSVKVIEKKD